MGCRPLPRPRRPARVRDRPPPLGDARGSLRLRDSPEDAILLKLVAFRRKDQVDVEEILKLVQELDRVYLREWAGRLAIADRLETFLREASSG